MTFLAVDIGGTFTDLIAFDEQDGGFLQTKSLTTPQDLSQGVVDCIRKVGLEPASIGNFIHGSTTAINTLIERKGAKVGLIVTRGTRDAYYIARANRPEAYNLFFQRAPRLTPRRQIVEVQERLRAGGVVWEPLDAKSVEQACETLTAEGVEAVAICLLHSYANPQHEEAIGAIVDEKMPGLFVSKSHEILREYREYERISTTVVNSYIGPKVAGYLQNLQVRLQEIGFRGDFAIMQSNGGVTNPAAAIRRPVTMLESGPVGGIIAGASVCAAIGYPDAVSFDMGGTTAKASLVREGLATTTDGYYVGGYERGHPVMVPVVDVVEVGAGGGSIAWLDEVGALKVGPQSAGAEPGPIAYGRGGTQPTITDANVILGRIGASDFLGGEMSLDREAAIEGMRTRIAEPLALSVPDAAKAVIDIAVARMSLAVREVSVHRGYDPRDFALIASGGAGPVHAVAIARELHIPVVIVPRFPSNFSALGMLMADERHDFVRTFYAGLAQADFGAIEAICDDMMREARSVLSAPDGVDYQIMLDLRYVGQEFTLSIPVSREQIRNVEREQIRSEFDAVHERRFAQHAKDEPLELINVRLVCIRQRTKVALPAIEQGAAKPPIETREVWLSGGPVACPVYRRDSLDAGQEIEGPALVNEYGTTTVIFEGDHLRVAKTGEMIIEVRKG